MADGIRQFIEKTSVKRLFWGISIDGPGDQLPYRRGLFVTGSSFFLHIPGTLVGSISH
ncbi:MULTISPECIES: hypothetical protein [Pirellulaceae]|uniref:hypothetical protein n=1 Tax=Pirellulaceae TaxID=2691357 RepID=UPI001304AA8A|nr:MULTISPECIES: hypothetical protein [Pirellulaceae]